MRNIKIQDVTAIVGDWQIGERIESLCKRCCFGSMSDECPQGVKLPLCFAQENRFKKPIYFKLKKEV